MKDKKHKRKKQKDDLEEVIATSSKIDSCEKDFQNGTKKLKKKQKKASEEFVDTDNVEAVEASSFENELKIKKKKKKRKRSNSECVAVEDAMNIDSEDNQKVKKKKKKHDSEIALLEAKDICEIDELETKKRQKKKKKKRHKSISPPSDAEAEEHLEEVPIKIKKKKKHKKNKEEEVVNSVQKKTDLQIGEENLTEKLKSKKKKRKKSKDKDESCDQNDNDTSGNKNPLENGTTLGQWSTASFEDKQRTEKFQRLLGGLKKDVTKPKGKLFGGLVARSGSNNALDKEGQEQLNKNLQAQYDSALSMRLGSVKGIGFGFSPPPGEGKKFYIDTGKSSSMKFNDAD